MGTEGEVNMPKQKHEHAATSNSRDSVSTFIGCTVSGTLTGVRERGSSHRGVFTIVFDCGWGLTVLSNGAYFVTNPETINDHVDDLNIELRLAGVGR